MVLATSCTDEGGTGDQDSAGEVPEGPSGTLVVANFIPFTGPNALFGPWQIGSCWAAVDLLNSGGGVLGNDLTCEAFDTQGNPAQAVPVAQQMVAGTPELVGVIGVSSDEAQASAPVLNEARIPFFAVTGLVDFNENELEYFWRIAPVDDGKGVAMALSAAEAGYDTAAIVATDDPGAQSIVDPLTQVFGEQGGEIVASVRLAGGQSSYRTEAQQILAANPDVILTETDERSAATMFAQMQELGEIPPVIGTEATHEPPYVQAVSEAIGTDEFQEKIYSVAPHVEMSGAAYDVFAESALSSESVAEATAGSDIDGEFLSTDPYAIQWYDEVNIFALAMIVAGTTDPATYNDFILEVTAPGDGKVQVRTFAEGKDALESGEEIQYVGAAGPYIFNEFHNSSPAYAAKRLVAPKETEIVNIVSVEEIASVMGAPVE